METKDKSILKKEEGEARKPWWDRENGLGTARTAWGQGERPGDRLMGGWLLEDSPAQRLAVYLSPGSFALQIFSAQWARNRVSGEDMGREMSDKDPDLSDTDQP